MKNMEQLFFKRLAIITVLTVTFMLSACRSTEDKVHSLTTEYIKSGLFNKTSYEEVYYQIDSLFTLDGSPDVFIELMELKDKIEELEELMKNSSDRNIGFDYDSIRAEKEIRKIKKKKNKIATTLEKLVELSSSDTAKFAGYFVDFSYTAEALNGDKKPGRLIAIVDKEGESIVYTHSFTILELLDYAMDKKLIWGEVIDYVNEIDSDNETIDIDVFLESIATSSTF